MENLIIPWSENMSKEELEYKNKGFCKTKSSIFTCKEPTHEQRENQAPTNSMIFIDPGVKTFITGYDPSGKIITWGENDIGRIARLLHYTRKLQSKIKKCNISKKKKSII